MSSACGSDPATNAEPEDEPKSESPRDAGKDSAKDAKSPSASDASTAKSDAKVPAKGDASAAVDEPKCRDFEMPADVDCTPVKGDVLTRDLRCTGLYGDFDKRAPACGVIEYKPAHELYSDGAEKRRWVSLPKGEKVNASAPNELSYPIGTRFWKEFRVKGSGDKLRLAETRLLEKRDVGWVYTSYVWNEAETEALQMKNSEGVPNLYGTGHTVPNRDGCKDCHSGRKDYVLGWDAIMLGEGATGVTRDNIVELGLVDDASALSLSIPGNDVERAALGYLHANCGISCHNENQDAPARESGLYLRLEAGELASVQTTDAFKSGMNKPAAQNAKLEGLPPEVALADWVSIRPQSPSTSLLIARQKLRGFEGQMPRIGTNKVDENGVKVVSDWIASMSRDAGYPAPKPLSK